MRTKFKYLLVSLLLIAIGFYYIFFVRSYKVDELKYLSLCTNEYSNEIDIHLAIGAEYISSHKQTKLGNDTLLIEIYTTHIGNIFNKKRDIKISMPIDDTSKYLVICNKTLSIGELRVCIKDS